MSPPTLRESISSAWPRPEPVDGSAGIDGGGTFADGASSGTSPTGFHAAMPSRQHRSSGCCCACACAALSSSGPTRGLLLPELKYQWAMGASFAMGRRDRKSVGLGKSVSVRVNLGGRRLIKKKHTHNTH